MADVIELLRELLIGSVIFLNDAPIAIQLVYRVEAPEWISVEYINGGVDPETRDSARQRAELPQYPKRLGAGASAEQAAAVFLRSRRP
jgi:hypothetical protein